MKKTIYHYILLTAILHSSFTHSMETSEHSDILEVTNSRGTTTHTYPKAQTWDSFTRDLLRKNLEKEINEQISEKVTIKASGENVSLALDYACKNPGKIRKLELDNPKIIIAGLEPLDYYWGNFPLSALDMSRLKGVSIVINDRTYLDDVKAIIELVSQPGISVSVPQYLKNWNHERKSANQKQNRELNTIIKQEKKIWWYNKLLLTSISGLILYVFYYYGYIK